jgi:photosystem II stability/assembly factor-like uncharacterized protein
MGVINRRQVLVAGAVLGMSGPVRAQPSGGWRVLATEPYRGKQDDISFVSPELGWYGNGAGKLYRTANGGETWEKVWEQPGTFIRALGFVDALNGFLGNVGTDYYPGVTDTRPLYRTRDGGATWTPIDAPGIGIVKGICGIDIVQERRIFQGALRDVTVIHAAGRVGGPATMLRSVDGGETWSVVDLRAQAGMILDVKFFDAQNGLVCAASSGDTAQANAMILRTSDGGATWTEAYRSARSFENCWKMSFPSRRVGYATVQNYEEGATRRVIVKTEDGGATWRELPLVDDARVRAFGIGFVDESRGWVGTTTSGFETRDGGASWVPVAMGQAVNKIRVLKQGQGFRAFAIGVQVHRLDG